jgi:uncharacterized phosphosugar-binding protein
MKNRLSSRLIAGTAALLLNTLPLSAGNAVGSDGRTGEGAEMYYRWLMSCVDGVEKDLPRIIASAEAAARIHVNNGRIAVTGDDLSFTYEAFGRSGGLMSLGTSATGGGRAIQITGLVAADMYQGQGPVKRPAGGNSLEIGFGSRSVLERALARGAPFDFTIDSHAAEHNGLFPADNTNWVVPTAQNANIVALWVWTGEFAAACTRLGKMPLMFQGFGDNGMERAKKLGCPEVLTGSGFGSGRMFHPEKPQPVEAGFAGKDYLRELRAILGRIHSNEMDNIRRVAATAAAAEAKGRVFSFLSGTHAASGNQNRLCKLAGVNFNLRRFQPGDAVFYVGFNFPDNTLADAARKAGATFMASYSTYEKNQDRPVQPPPGMNPDELFVEQHWPFGDCAVQFPGYDIKILPPSGVVAEAITGMVLAELQKIRAGAPTQEPQQPK